MSRGPAGDAPERALEVIAGVVSIVALGAALLGVVNRLWLSGQIRAVDEVARFALAWFTAMAVGVASGRGLHYRLGVGISSFFPRRLRPRFARVQLLVSDLAVGGLILWAAVEWLPTAHLRQSLILEVPLSWPHASIAVMGLLVIVFGLRSFIRDRGAEPTNVSTTGGVP